MSGRREHNQYKPLGFIKKKNEKGGNVAFCMLCKHDLGNTAVKRLEAHRRICNKKNENVSINPAHTDFYDTINNNTSSLSIVSCSTACEDDPDIIYEQDINSNINNKRKAPSSNEIDINSSYNKSSEILLSKGGPNVNDTNDVILKKTVHDIPKHSSRKQSSKLKPFIDNIDEKETVKINEALIELFIAYKIQLNCLESKYLKNIFQLLRPAYSLPKAHNLKQLFDQVYDKHINKTYVCKSSGILLITVQENNQITSMTFNSEGNYLFIKSANSLDMPSFLKTSVSETKRKYNKEVYAIVSDYEQHMPFIDENTKFWYFKCMSQRLRSFIQETVDYNFVQKVKNLTAVFENIELQEEIIKCNGESWSAMEKEDYHSHLKTFQSCLTNLKPMRQVVGNSQVEFCQSIISLLFDSQFELKLKENIRILKYVHEKLSNKHQLMYTRAMELDDWITLLNNTENENMKKSIEHQIHCLSDPVTLTAHTLHPCYQGRNMKHNEVENTKKIIQFLITELNEAGVQSYFQYQDNSDIFGKLSLKNIQSPIVYWRLCQEQHRDLAIFALKILQIPAFTNEIRTNVSEGGGFVDLEQEKMLELYYLLKLNE